MALYMIGFISYGATLVFYAAVFPRLARNTQHARELREKYEKGEVSAEEYEVEESMEKNRISNISTVSSSCHRAERSLTDVREQMHSNVGYIVTLALNLSLLIPLMNHPKVNNYVIVL